MIALPAHFAQIGKLPVFHALGIRLRSIEQPGNFRRSQQRMMFGLERSQLLETVWGSDVVVGDRTVDVHVKALRRKLEEAGADSRVLETVRGVGYRLRDG